MLWIQQVALFPPQPGPAVFYNAQGVLQSQVMWQKQGSASAITQLPPVGENVQLLWFALLYTLPPRKLRLFDAVFK